MLKKIIPVLVATALSMSVFAQNTADKKDPAEAEPAKSGKTTDIRMQATTTDAFDINQLTFNRKVDPQGKGELLLVEFALTPNTDYKYKLYIHVIATVEHEEWVTNTIFGKKMFLKGLNTDLFIPFPAVSDLKNFEYQIDGKTQLIKFPHDYKTGVDPQTKEPYLLERYAAVQTRHLAPYKKKFKYFNYATIIIFDDEGKVMFKQIYSLDKFRR